MGKSRTRLIAAVMACLCAVAIVVGIGIAPGAGSLPFAPTAESAAGSALDAAAEGSAAEGASGASGPSGVSGDESQPAKPANPADSEAASDDASVYEPGVVLATLSPGIMPDEALESLASIPGLTGTAVEELIGDDLVKLALPEGVSVRNALDAFEGAEAIAAVQPNYRYYIQEIAAAQPVSQIASQFEAEAQPELQLEAQTEGSQLAPLATQALSANDPYYRAGKQWSLASINAPDAWESVAATASSKQVTVAVMDEGFLTYHEDLMNTIVNPYDAVSSTASALAAYNEGHSAHGTHVAGIIAAEANNAKGIAGVAYNNCKVMPIKVADAQGGITTDTLVKGYNYLLSKSSKSDSTTVAKKLNVRVVNLSLGTSRDEENDVPDTSLKNAISQAWSNGIVTVAAACNIDDEYTDLAFKAYPCDFANVVGVIALEPASNSDGVRRDPSSNFNTSMRVFRLNNESKNISAPGSSIVSTYTNDATNPANNQYSEMSGTSMATPVVSGTLALMFKANPDLTASQATTKLYNTARDLTASAGTTVGWDRYTGYGEVDAAAAVASVAPSVSGPAEISYDSTGSFSILVGTTRQDATAFTWTSSNENVAKVSQVTSSACVVTPVGGGSATITATKGDLAASQTVTVTWPTITGPSVVVPGTTFDCGISVGKSAGSSSDWEWSSSDESVARIAATGQVEALAEGQARITAVNAANGFSASKVITVAPELSIGLLDIEVSDVTYSGAQLTPQPVVSNGSYVLRNGIDYKVTGYSNNVNAGVATVTIAGMRPYVGNAARNFTIRKASIGAASVSLNTVSLSYTGKTRKPVVKSVIVPVGNSTVTLRSGTDYTVKNPGVKLGTGMVTITGAGNYSGTITEAYAVKMVKKSVYQLYNKRTGQWFYTTSAADRTSMASKGWTRKGVAFKTPSRSTKPVWRLYNPKAKVYRYTSSVKQRKNLVSSGWKRQGVAFYSDDYKSKRVYAHYRKANGSWRYSTSRSITGYTRKSILCYAL